MTEIKLTQNEADILIAMEKVRIDDRTWNYPDLGGYAVIPLESSDKREQFTLDIRRGRIDLLRGTYQNRSRNVVVLLRLDFGGQPHRNPDGEEIPSPHIHVYREGYGDKWARPVPSDAFAGCSDPWTALEDFMSYCNITRKPNIVKGLFT